MKKLNLKKVTLGSDPELFFMQESGKYISSIGIVPGTKSDPYPIPGMEEGYATQTDNVAVEYNIPPASTEESFSNNIQNALDYIQRIATAYSLIISKEPYAIFDEDQLASDEAKAIGCDPDYNAHTMTVNIKESFLDGGRSCGGHISVGYPGFTNDLNVELVKAMDLYLGVPSILMDMDEKRRTLYGQAGCFRHTGFGVEYRTLSNFWTFSDELRKWAFKNTMQAVEFVLNGNKIDEELGDMLQDTINHSNKDKATELVKKFNLEVIVKEESLVPVAK